MPSMDDLLSRFSKAVAGLQGANEPSGPVEMTPEQFIQYATEQLEKAATDSDDIKVQRLEALKTVVEDVAKNYEGKTPTPLTGLLSVNQFKDPAQQVPTSKTINPPTQGNGATNFSANDVPPTQGAGSAPTGTLVPSQSDASASFTKALQSLTDVLEKMAGTKKEVDPKKDETKKSDDLSDTKSTDKKEDGNDTTSVTKNVDVAGWPADMNTAYGRGETDNPGVPEWGFDFKPESDGARVSE